MARKQQSSPASPASPASASAPEPAPEADALAATDTTYLDARPSAAEGRGFVADIVHSMFNPGINASVVIFMNISMLAVFISLIGLGLAWEFNIHVGVLLFADVGLFFSTQWCVRRLLTRRDSGWAYGGWEGGAQGGARSGAQSTAGRGAEQGRAGRRAQGRAGQSEERRAEQDGDGYDPPWTLPSPDRPWTLPNPDRPWTPCLWRNLAGCRDPAPCVLQGEGPAFCREAGPVR